MLILIEVNAIDSAGGRNRPGIEKMTAKFVCRNISC
jgi:hypothetical protein